MTVKEDLIKQIYEFDEIENYLSEEEKGILKKMDTDELNLIMILLTRND